MIVELIAQTFLRVRSIWLEVLMMLSKRENRLRKSWLAIVELDLPFLVVCVCSNIFAYRISVKDLDFTHFARSS